MSTKTPAFVGAALLLLGATVGCESTTKGISEDINRNTAGVTTAAKEATAKTQKAVANAGQEIHQAGANLVAATTLRPLIKTAIIADTVLRNPQNSITVDAGDQKIHLSGHVLTPRMKERAEEDAQAILDKHHSTAKIVNDLQVMKS